MAIIAILASLSLKTVSKAYYKSRLIIVKVSMFHDIRLRTMAADNVSDDDVNWVLTNTPHTFIEDDYVKHLVKRRK